MDGHLRERDVDVLVSVIEDARRDEDAEPMPWALLEGLQRLIPCDIDVSFQWHEPARWTNRVIQAVAEDGTRGVECGGTTDRDDPFWQLWPTSMCSWPQRTGNLREVIHTGDFLPTEQERRADPMLRYLSILTYSMIVSMPAPPGEVRRVIFMRSEGPPFTERDRAVATLLRPHLQELWLDAERRRRGVPRLTEREWEVLELAASGMSNADIADGLYLSLATVRKHMENIRGRLGVHSLAAAAAAALPRPDGAAVRGAG
jgi:DNA-binding CsgD family transcriptional regulator